MDSIPLVILSGQVATSLIGYDAFQGATWWVYPRPVVKHSFLVKQTEDIPQVLKKAFWLAASGRPGPVVVDLPKDILNPAKKLPYSWPESVSMRSYNPTTTGHKRTDKTCFADAGRGEETGCLCWWWRGECRLSRTTGANCRST